MTEEGRTADRAERRERELDGRIEGLVGQLVEVIGSAPSAVRADMRDYALSLLREGTEVDVPDAPPPGRAGSQPGTNSTALGLLIGLVGLPAILLFPPIGLALVGMAAVIIVWGVIGSLIGGTRRRR